MIADAVAAGDAARREQPRDVRARAVELRVAELRVVEPSAAWLAVTRGRVGEDAREVHRLPGGSLPVGGSPGVQRPGRSRLALARAIRFGEDVPIDLKTITRPVGRLGAAAQNALEVARFGGLATDEEPSPYEVAQRAARLPAAALLPGLQPRRRPRCCWFRR